MSPPLQNAFTKDAEMYHEQIQEMYKKDKKMQEEMREEFSHNPDGQRRRFEDIEAQALGFRYNEMNELVDEKGRKVSENDTKKLEKNITEAMLNTNPLFIEMELQYKDGLIYPKDWKKLKEESKKAKTRGS